ncbi:hypothetical protein [Caldanaerovirga acetigignens]|uniref:hypothetical protein n=1 Tax=Caldanaerovirga acetigignens TaxID=447595 RepID=UPI00093498E8|nr:hypothetical protein [Caldanaerovirga acetigignens]
MQGGIIGGDPDRQGRGGGRLCSPRQSEPLAASPRRDVIIAGAVRRINTRPEAGVVVIFYTAFV